MSGLLGGIGVAATAVFAYMTVAFALAMLVKRNDIADVAWGVGFIVVALVAAVRQWPPTPRMWLVVALVAAWGVRLAVHIHMRNRGKAEDFRYAQWREQWGKHFVLRTYLQVFLLQGLLMLLIATPVVVVGVSREPEPGWLALLGTAVWLVGFVFESVGDWQLLAFKRRPETAGSIMQSGLWAYTRHPNYFGEVAQWWGIWVIALPMPFGPAAVVGPLTITFLLLKVSGIPMLERKYAGDPEFEAYKRRTSAFFPLPPRRRAG